MGHDTGGIGKRLSTWVLAALAPAVVFVGTSRAVMNNYQTDFWHHLARGRAIVERGRLVNEDIFTFTVAGKPLRDPNWLTQIAYYRLYQAGSMPLIRLVNSLALAAMMGLVVFSCWRASGFIGLGAALGLFAFFGMWQLLIVRPQTVSLLLFALLFVVLDHSEQRRRWLLLVPVLFALWANVHGGFPIGLYLVAVFLLSAGWEATFSESEVPIYRRVFQDRRVRNLAICLTVSLLAVGINPYGFKIFTYIDHTGSSAVERNIAEWTAPPLNLLIGKVWIASMLLAVVALVLPRQRPRARDVFLVLCFLPLPCMAVRMVPWWLLVSMPVVAGQLGAWVRSILPSCPVHSPEAVGKGEKESSDKAAWLVLRIGQLSAILWGVSLFLLVLVVGLSLPGPDRLVRESTRALQAVRHRLETGRQPQDGDLLLHAGVTDNDLEKIARHLREMPGRSRHVFCRFEWGEYLGWALQPEGCRIFADGRIEIYPDPVWSDYLALMQARADWEKILERYRVNCLVLDAGCPDHVSALIPAVERSGNWRRACEAGEAVLFLRISGDSACSPEAPAPLK